MGRSKKQETLQADLNNSESKEQLLQIAKSIQNIDEQVFDLNERRKEILKNAKSSGFNDKALRTAIAELRKPKDDLQIDEEAMYKELITDVIEPLK